MKNLHKNIVFRYVTLYTLVLFSISGYAQSPAFTNTILSLKKNNSSGNFFVENIGQYGTTLEHFENMGNIKYGYEGLNMPILFTPKGIIHLQRKIETLTHKQEEELEKLGVPEDEIEKKKNVTNRVITMEWVGINPNEKIVAEDNT